MRAVVIKRSKEEFCSCNSCNATTYEAQYDTRKTETMYEVKIGCMVNRLCADCLAELAGKAIAELAKEK